MSNNLIIDRHFLTSKEIRNPDNKLDLIRKYIPNPKILHLCNALLLEDKDCYYILKIRPGYEFRMLNEIFQITNKQQIIQHMDGCNLSEELDSVLMASYTVIQMRRR